MNQGQSAELNQNQNCVTPSYLKMARDATTEKGHHFYGVDYSNNNCQIYTSAFRDVCDTTPDIQNLINNTCFMTDRSSTEGKTNILFDNQKTIPCNSHNFKCAVENIDNDLQRINILFYNGAGTFFLGGAKHLIDYI